LGAVNTEELDLTRILPGSRYCTGCAERVCERVRAIPGVTASRCDVVSGVLSIDHDIRELPARRLAEGVRRIALEEADAVVHAAYRLEGLD